MLYNQCVEMLYCSLSAMLLLEQKVKAESLNPGLLHSLRY